MFQSTVRRDQTTGIVGEILFSGPTRAKPGILDSTAATNNVIGRAFRHLTGEDQKVSADVAAGAPFAGILVNPKVYALQGAAAGTLEPTLQLANENQVELLDMGIILVDLSQDSPTDPRRNIGDNVWFETATGILVGVESGTTVVAGYEQVPNAKIVRANVTNDPGLAFIQLTN